MFGFHSRKDIYPRIKINYGNIIKESSIYICGWHLHHWIIYGVISTIIIINKEYNMNKFG
jgi:hypothetical protein